MISVAILAWMRSLVVMLKMFFRVFSCTDAAVLVADFAHFSSCFWLPVMRQETISSVCFLCALHRRPSRLWVVAGWRCEWWEETEQG